MKTISVIVPVYNVEKYLVECLESIIHQTYQNLQIILVDDGSTDSSGTICDEYAKTDSRITVVHQTNQGAGAAKNAGLELINGDYFTLLDSDDFFELSMFEIMINQMNKYHAEIIQCMFYNEFIHESCPREYNFQKKHIRRIDETRFLFEMLYDWKYSVFWNKLYKTSLLKNARFPEKRRIDDEFFTYKLVCNARSIVCIDDCLCHYRMRQSSVMNDTSNTKLLYDRIEAFVERYSYIAKRFPSLERYYYLHLSSYINDQKIISDEKLIPFLEKKKQEYPLKKMSMVNKLRIKIKLFSSRTLLPLKERDESEYFV